MNDKSKFEEYTIEHRKQDLVSMLQDEIRKLIQLIDEHEEKIEDIRLLCNEKILNSTNSLTCCRDKNSFYAGMCEGEILAYNKILDFIVE